MHSFNPCFLYIYGVIFSQKIVFRLASLKRQLRILNTEQKYIFSTKFCRLLDYACVAIIIIELNKIGTRKIDITLCSFPVL